jgi:16S rRNA (uracil1498-N3)-methyltransferase
LPAKHIYLFWGLLKRDNNEHILQKCTEIGISNFIPLLTERTIKREFNIERARKIVIEASEQCGRSNIPIVREPIHLEKALDEYVDKLYFLVCQEGNESKTKLDFKKYGLLIGPEGGWSDNEKKIFSDRKIPIMNLGDLTLRAETAAVVASAKLLQ